MSSLKIHRNKITNDFDDSGNINIDEKTINNLFPPIKIIKEYLTFDLLNF